MKSKTAEALTFKKHPKELIPLRALLLEGEHLQNLKKLRPALFARLEHVSRQEQETSKMPSEQRISISAERNMLRAVIDWLDKNPGDLE